MSAASRRQKHKEELRRIILDAARDIFVRQGYESFSMRKLAEKIEYSPGSVYLHFKNKDELFDRLTEESFARLLQTFLNLRNGREPNDPFEELKRAMRVYVEFGLRNPNDYRFAFMLRPPVEKRPYKVHQAFDVLRDIVRRCVAEGRFWTDDVETTAQILWASAHGITSLLIQRPAFPWVSKKKLLEQVIHTAIDGLLAVSRPVTVAGGAHDANVFSE